MRPLLGHRAALLSALLLISGCMLDNAPPSSLRQAQPSGGPRIVFELDERPFPEIPFPNDLATTPDASSPTGLRLNLSVRGASREEERVRHALNTQTGFGLFSPITVRFDRPIDLVDLARRHQEPTPDLRDDAIYLINVDPKSPEYGKLELLDVGRGNFPALIKGNDRYFTNDPRSAGTNLLFESVEEVDHNGNGVLDPIEDTDDDGVWDKPNILTPGADPLAEGQTLDHYERETNTLILRPVEPLAPATRYAVVLTGALRGEDGLPIDSPFKSIHHLRQFEALQPLRELLPRAFPERFDRKLEAVRFAWSFTTGTPTAELEAIRAGLYGHGPLRWLEAQFAPDLHLIHAAREPGLPEPMLFRINRLIGALAPVVAQEAGAEGGQEVSQSYEHVDYVVSGAFLSPYFLADKDELADPLPGEETPDAEVGARMRARNPHDEDEAFELDLSTGRAHARAGEVTFACVVPKPTATQQAPFPTIIYSHAIGTTRFEMLVFAGAMAKFGMATCAIDNAGHGLAIPPEYESLVATLTRAVRLPHLGEILQHHRARDVNNDGLRDGAADYFTADLLHARDMVRQTTVDQLQLIRILRSFDGTRRFPTRPDPSSPYVRALGEAVAPFDHDGDGEPELAGDFNGDGRVDLGGPTTYMAWGTSLGGIQATTLAGVEPTIRAVASNAGGGGLGDIATRTDIGNVRVGVLLKMMGPLLIGEPAGEGRTQLSWLLPDALDDRQVPFAQVEGLEDGDLIVLRNLAREREPLATLEDRRAHARVRQGRFRLGVGADALGGQARRAALGLDVTLSVEAALGCAAQPQCEAQPECPARHSCDEAGLCVPITQCVAGADDSSLSEDAARHVATDPLALGDGLVIELYGANGALKQRLERTTQHAVFQNILYPADSPLAALASGWGVPRQTPRMRRLLGIGQLILEPADPAIWASHYHRRPLRFDYEAPEYRVGLKNSLIVVTQGDQTVPMSSGLALARAAGAIDVWGEDARYGMTPNQFLAINHVYEGIARFDRYPDHPGTLFDPDDLDRGRFRVPGREEGPTPNVDADVPLRAMTQTRAWGGVTALRLPYIRIGGEHTFNVPNPSLAFDIHTFMLNQVAWYLATAGRALSDDPCMERGLSMADCAFYDPETFAIDWPLGPAPL